MKTNNMMPTQQPNILGGKFKRKRKERENWKSCKKKDKAV